MRYLLPPRASASVALLTEGVDRNYICPNRQRVDFVALLTEGVDRNTITEVQGSYGRLSPSSRRAWIEMPPKRCPDR